MRFLQVYLRVAQQHWDHNPSFWTAIAAIMLTIVYLPLVVYINTKLPLEAIQEALKTIPTVTNHEFEFFTVTVDRTQVLDIDSNDVLDHTAMYSIDN